MVRQNSRFDGEDRLIVPHAMPHFPLIIAVSDTMATVLRAWREQIRVLVATTVLLELMIAGAVLLAMRHLRSQGRLLAAETARARAEAELPLAEERERAAQALHTAAAALRHGGANMVQGLLMVDGDGNRRWSPTGASASSGVCRRTASPGMTYAELTQLVVAARQCSARRHGARPPLPAGSGRQ